MLMRLTLNAALIAVNVSNVMLKYVAKFDQFLDFFASAKSSLKKKGQNYTLSFETISASLKEQTFTTSHF